MGPSRVWGPVLLHRWNLQEASPVFKHSFKIVVCVVTVDIKERDDYYLHLRPCIRGTVLTLILVL